MRSDAPPAPPERAALWLWGILIALVAARGALAFVPGMWGWGMNLLRFASWPAWVLWGLAALALAPPIARASTRVLERLGRLGARAGAATFAVVGAALVWSFPDRTRFVGDFLMREITSRTGTSIFATLYPQGQPLDALLHDRLVRALSQALGLEAGEVGRLIGVVGAALLGVLAFRFARAVAESGAARLAAATAVLCGGWLPLFAGYNKAFAELTVVAAAIAVFGLDAARRGRGLLALGVTFALGLALHRLALGFLPAVVAAWVLALRGPLADGGWKRPLALAAGATPLAALAVAAPSVLRAWKGYDLAGNFTSSEVQRQGGVFAAALSPLHLADWVSVLLLLAPLAPLAALAPWVRTPGPRRRDRVVLAALIVPMVGFTLFFHPPQGLFRDWDAFAASAATLSLGAAWVVGAIVERPGGARLGLAVMLAAAAPSVAWLAHNADETRGIARVEAYLAGPPARGDLATASVWDFVGMRTMEYGEAARAAAAFARAAEIAPSPKILRAWAVAEFARGDAEAARGIYRRLIARAPGNAMAWVELAMISLRMGDAAGAREAAERALALEPRNPRARQVLESLGPAGAAGSAAPGDPLAPR